MTSSLLSIGCQPRQAWSPRPVPAPSPASGPLASPGAGGPLVRAGGAHRHSCALIGGARRGAGASAVARRRAAVARPALVLGGRALGGRRRRLGQGRAGSERDGAVTRYSAAVRLSRELRDDPCAQGHRKAGVGAGPPAGTRPGAGLASPPGAQLPPLAWGGRGPRVSPDRCPPHRDLLRTVSGQGRCPARLDSSAPRGPAQP